MKESVSPIGTFKEFSLVLETKFSEMTGFLETTITALRRDGTKVGHAIFGDEDGFLYPLSVWLDDDVQRMGLGTAMYVWAERRTKMRIIPSRDQKPAGKAFWSQPNRPFGN